MMKPIVGDQATRIVEESDRRNRESRAEELAECKEVAAANGKEPFDLDKLGEYIDLTWRVECSDYPQVVTREEKIEHYEERYYVSYPDVMTLKDFAVKVEELRLWDLE
jgi:hypothetical protein